MTPTHRQARSFAALAMLAVAAGCAGSPESPVVPHTAAVREELQPHRFRFLVHLPVIAAPSPAPAPGGTELSSMTRSIAASIRKRRFGPIALSSGTPGCSTTNAGLACTIALELDARDRNAVLNLEIYATARGTGPAIAYGTQNLAMVGTPAWVGLATKIAAVANPSTLIAGIPASSTIVTYGVDAAGGLIGNTAVQLPSGARIGKIAYSASGPYGLRTRQGLFQPVYLPYDGARSGVEKIVVRTPGLPPASVNLPIVVQASPAPLIFAGIATASSQAVAEFALGSSGDAAPVNVPVWASPAPAFFGADRANNFWAMTESGNHYGGAVAEHFTSGLNWLGTVALPGMFSAGVDRGGNFYATIGSQVVVYAAGTYGKKFLRSISTPFTCNLGMCPTLAVDGPGDVYVGGLNFGIDEYAPGVAGYAPPIRTLSTSGAYPTQLAADDVGDLFAAFADASGNENGIWEYPAGTTTPHQLLGGLSVSAFGVDGSGRVYAVVPTAGSQFEIDVVSPGAIAPTSTIAGPDTGLIVPGGIAVTP